MRMGRRCRRRGRSFSASPTPSTPSPIAVMGIQTEGKLTEEAVEFLNVATGHHHCLFRRTGRVTGAVWVFEKVEDLGGLLDEMTFIVIFDGLYRDESILRKAVLSTVIIIIRPRLLNGMARYEMTRCEFIDGRVLHAQPIATMRMTVHLWEHHKFGLWTPKTNEEEAGKGRKIIALPQIHSS